MKTGSFLSSLLKVTFGVVLALTAALPHASGQITLDSTPTVANGAATFTSALVVGGNPAVIYYNAGSPKSLYYRRSTTATGSLLADWGAPVTVDTGGTVGQWVSMVMINGVPAASYNRQTGTTSGLDFIFAGDSLGATWPAGNFINIDHTSGNTGQYTSLAAVNGNPAISYYDGSSGQHHLKYVRATNASGSAWGAPITVDPTANDVGQYTSLLVVNGNPAISYYDVTNGDLLYVRATNANGTAWGSPVVVASTGNVGQYTSMIIVNGNPAISYYDVTNGDLKFVRADSVDGSTWGTTAATVASTGNVGEFTSLAIIGGYPAISYYDVTNANLDYVVANDASGTTWGTATAVDSTGDVGRSTSLVALAGGSPAISYQDTTNGTLKWSLGPAPPVAPTVTTATQSSVTSTSAVLGGNVTSDGGASVTDRGIVWATSANPTTANTKVANGTGTGAFSATVSGFTPGTVIHVRAYAINSVGTSYGSDISFTTLALATVTTATQSSVTSTSAVLGGNVTSDGGAAVTDRGIVWATSANPTTADTKVANGTGTGSFSATVSGLPPGTLIHVRAYAINSVGTSYGGDISFTTLALPTVTTATQTNVTSTSAVLGGNVLLDGGAAVTDRGIVWNTTGTPTTADTKVPIGSGTGSFSATVTLPSSTTVYVRAYAINSVGTSYGNSIPVFVPGAPDVTTAAPIAPASGLTYTLGGTVNADNGAFVTDYGIVYGTSAFPTTVTGTVVSMGSSAATAIPPSVPYSGPVTLPASTVIYVRAYATNSVGTSYGADSVAFTAGAPSVTTAAQSGVTATSAVLGGTVTSDVGSTVTEYGIVWGLSVDPTTSDHKVAMFTGAAAAIPPSVPYSATVGSLPVNTLIYVRAYAINGVATNYGDDISFVTVGSPPTVTTTAQSSVTSTSAVLGGNVTSDGGTPVTDRGIVWGLSANPTTGDNKVPSGSPTGTGVFSDTVTGFTPGTTIHVRAYAINSVGTGYGGDISFTPQAAATVTTDTQTSVTSTSAVLGGNVTSDGGAAVTDRGIVWGASLNPTTADTKVANGTGTGAFSATVTGFSPGTLVHVRAYAINSVGTSYGGDISFYTSPTVTVAAPGNGTYNDSDVLTFTVSYGVIVTVDTTGGTPYITVDIGGVLRHAVYVSGSGSANLVFKYTVQSVDLDLDGITLISPIVTNGGTIKDGSGTDLPLAFTPPVTTGVFVDGRVVSTGGASPDSAPGTTVGGASVGTWDSIRSGMVIAPNGALAFRAFLVQTGSVTASNYQGIWKSPDGSYANTYLMARTGSDAPDTGTTNALFDLLPLNPYIDNLGQNTFVGFLRVGTGVAPVTDGTNDSGVWSEQATAGAGPRLVLRQGDAVTGGTVTMVAPSGWAAVSQPATTSADGYAAFNVQLNGNTPTPGSALLRVKSSAASVTVSTLALEGGAAPNIGGGTLGTFAAMYGNSNDPRMDGAGNVAFLAYMVDGSSGIFYDDAATSTLSAVARSGEATPTGPADTFTGFERPSLASNGGQIAFRAFLATTGQSVWEGDPTVPGGLVAIAKTGDTALSGIPAGSQLNSVWSPFSNASGKVAFRVSLLDGASVETRAIVTDTNGTLGVIAKVGDAAPGTADTFTNFDHPIIGNSNQVAFSATTATTTGIWAQAPGGGALSLKLKVGDSITSNSVTRTVGAFIVVGTASSDRLSEVTAMNAAGQILVWIAYTNGDTGMLLTAP